MDKVDNFIEVLGPDSWLRTIRHPNKIMGSASVLLGEEWDGRLEKLQAIKEFSEQESPDLRSVFVYSFSALYLTSLIGAFSRLYLAVPKGCSLQDFFSEQWRTKSLPPLRQNDVVAFQSRMQNLFGWKATRWQSDARIFLAGGILSAALQLRGVVKLGRQKSYEFANELASLSTEEITVGNLTEPTGDELILTLGNRMCELIFDEAGLSHRVPGKLWDTEEEMDEVLQSLEYACRSLSPVIEISQIDQMSARLSLEYARTYSQEFQSDSYLSQTYQLVIGKNECFFRFGDDILKTKVSKGMHIIAKLLAAPNRDISCIHLSDIENEFLVQLQHLLSVDAYYDSLAEADNDDDDDDVAKYQEVAERVSFQPILDDDAVVECLNRLEELKQEIKHSKEVHEKYRHKHLCEEFEFLVTSLKEAFGIRVGNSTDENMINTKNTILMKRHSFGNKDSKKPIDPSSLMSQLKASVRQAIFRAYKELESHGSVGKALAQCLRTAINRTGNSYRYTPHDGYYWEVTYENN